MNALGAIALVVSFVALAMIAIELAATYRYVQALERGIRAALLHGSIE